MSAVMAKEELKKKIHEVIKGVSMGCFATIKDGKPWVRYVMVSGDENLDIYFTAMKQSRKIRQIQADPHCHVLVGGDAKDFTKSLVQVAGRAEILEDLETKKKFWQEYHKTMFKGPDDPNFVVIRVKPGQIELWGGGKMEPEVYDVH